MSTRFTRFQGRGGDRQGHVPSPVRDAGLSFAVPDLAPVTNVPFSFVPSAPISGTWASIGTPLPAWASLNPATGEISGTPDGPGLVTDLGVTSGVVLRVTGSQTATSNPFTITQAGAALPVPTIYFSMDDADVVGTSLINNGGGGSDATISGAVTSAPGLLGQARNFGGNGSTDRAVMDAFVFQTQLPNSFHAWGKPNVFTTSYARMFLSMRDVTSTARSLEIGIVNDGRLFLGIFDDVAAGTSIFSAGPLTLGGWNACGFVWGGDATRQGQLYLGGLADGSGISGPVSGGSSENMIVGAQGGVDRGFSGDIDEYALWENLELDAGQMATNYWLGATGVTLRTWIGF